MKTFLMELARGGSDCGGDWDAVVRAECLARGRRVTDLLKRW
jgi:hypothetical protein